MESKLKRWWVTKQSQTKKQYRLKLKDFRFVLLYVVLLMPWLGLYGSTLSSGLVQLAWFWVLPFYIFVCIPVLDFIIGEDKQNPEQNTFEAKSHHPWFRWILILFAPLFLINLLFASYFFVNSSWTWFQNLGWIISHGLLGGGGIVIAHELIHKNRKLDQTAGGLILALVFYGGFKVEHIRGHHRNVSTPHDQSSAKFNQSIYHFLPRAILGNVKNAWLLEAERLKKASKPVFSFQNENITWLLVSLVFLTFAVATLGVQSIVFLACTGLIAILLLETVNYIEHYGLERRQLTSGRYERTQPWHSWNSSHAVSNIFLIMLQRHSDHHYIASRNYQVLLHHPDAPQLPAGYTGLAILAWVPLLWFKVMNPRVLQALQDKPVTDSD